MKTLATTSLAALMAMFAVMPASTTPAEARHGRGLAIGAGVVLGAAALAAAAEARDRRGYSWRRQCRRWYIRCEDGSDWACEKYDRHCD